MAAILPNSSNSPRRARVDGSAWRAFFGAPRIVKINGRFVEARPEGSLISTESRSSRMVGWIGAHGQIWRYCQHELGRNEAGGSKLAVLNTGQHCRKACARKCSLRGHPVCSSGATLSPYVATGVGALASWCGVRVSFFFRMQIAFASSLPPVHACAYSSIFERSKLPAGVREAELSLKANTRLYLHGDDTLYVGLGTR